MQIILKLWLLKNKFDKKMSTVQNLQAPNAQLAAYRAANEAGDVNAVEMNAQGMTLHR